MKNFSALQLDAIAVHAPEPPAARSVEHRLGANPAPALTPMAPRAKTVREILAPTTPAAPAGRRFSISTAALLLLAVLVWLLGTGCATDRLPTEKWTAKFYLDPEKITAAFSDEPSPDRVFGRSFRPSNAHLGSPDRLAKIRRVLILPMNLSDDTTTSAAGRDLLEPLVATELGKTKHFELLQITRAQLKQWTGRTEWTAEDPIAPETLARLREETAAEAILFSRLTQFRAYPPLAVGWSLKLVALHDAHILWATDEVFDAGEPTVVTAARRYYREHHSDRTALADSRSMLNSPSRFGRYAAHATFASLPGR